MQIEFFGEWGGREGGGGGGGQNLKEEITRLKDLSTDGGSKY
jgi:hypothetical protein